MMRAGGCGAVRGTTPGGPSTAPAVSAEIAPTGNTIASTSEATEQADAELKRTTNLVVREGRRLRVA